MILDHKKNESTKIGKRIIVDDKTGKKRSVRVSRISGEMLA